jgi:hypothetical protein
MKAAAPKHSKSAVHNAGSGKPAQGAVKVPPQAALPQQLTAAQEHLAAKLQQAQDIAEQKLAKELQEAVDRKAALQAKRDQNIKAIEASRALRETRRREMIVQFEKWSGVVSNIRHNHLSAIDAAFYDRERARLTSVAVRSAAVLRIYERGWLLLDADADGAVGDSDLVASFQAMECDITQQQAVDMMWKTIHVLAAVPAIERVCLQKQILKPAADAAAAGAIAPPLLWSSVRDAFVAYVNCDSRVCSNPLFDVVEYLVAVGERAGDLDRSLHDTIATDDAVADYERVITAAPPLPLAHWFFDPALKTRPKRRAKLLRQLQASLAAVLDVLVRRFGPPAEHNLIDIFGDLSDPSRRISLAVFLRACEFGASGRWGAEGGS